MENNNKRKRMTPEWEKCFQNMKYQTQKTEVNKMLDNLSISFKRQKCVHKNPLDVSNK